MKNTRFYTPKIRSIFIFGMLGWSLTSVAGKNDIPDCLTLSPSQSAQTKAESLLESSQAIEQAFSNDILKQYLDDDELMDHLAYTTTSDRVNNVSAFLWMISQIEGERRSKAIKFLKKTSSAELNSLLHRFESDSICFSKGAKN